MHDPEILVCSIQIPLPWRVANTLRKDKKKEWATYNLADIWHVDPEKDGTDDSCGWFMRSRHGDKAVLAKIVSRFDFDWDRVFESDSGNCYHCGFFKPSGAPHHSVIAIALNLFWLAAFEVFGSRMKAQRFMRRNLLDILLFAENPFDSLHDGITLKFSHGIMEGRDLKYSRKERIENMAACIYGWILRAERPWWKHPRFHFWHWRIQVRPLLRFKRWAFSRCCKCGKRFSWRDARGNVVSNLWDSDGPQWFRSERGLEHFECAKISEPMQERN